MANFLTIESIRELGWGANVLLLVFLTLLVRFIVLRLLRSIGRHLARTENVWDDSLLEAAPTCLELVYSYYGFVLCR